MTQQDQQLFDDLSALVVLDYIKESADFMSRILDTQALDKKSRIGLILALARSMMERAMMEEPEMFEKVV